MRRRGAVIMGVPFGALLVVWVLNYSALISEERAQLLTRFFGICLVAGVFVIGITVIVDVIRE
jgi:hypothetical protein